MRRKSPSEDTASLEYAGCMNSRHERYLSPSFPSPDNFGFVFPASETAVRDMTKGPSVIQGKERGSYCASPGKPDRAFNLFTAPGEANSPINASHELTAARPTQGDISGRSNPEFARTEKPPSNFCHICIRKTKPERPHVACSNTNCRKTVCAKCIIEVQWTGKTFLGSRFECPHCLGACRDMKFRIPQCEHYQRAAEKRRTLRGAIAKSRRPFRSAQGLAQRAIGRLSRAKLAKAPTVSRQKRNFLAKDDQPLLCQSVIPARAPKDRILVELTQPMTDSAIIAGISGHSKAIDAAIVATTSTSSINSIFGGEYSTPFHPDHVPGTSLDTVEFSSDFGLQRIANQDVEVPAVIAAIDSAIDGTVENAIGDAM